MCALCRCFSLLQCEDLNFNFLKFMIAFLATCTHFHQGTCNIHNYLPNMWCKSIKKILSIVKNSLTFMPDASDQIHLLKCSSECFFYQKLFVIISSEWCLFLSFHVLLLCSLANWKCFWLFWPRKLHKFVCETCTSTSETKV